MHNQARQYELRLEKMWVTQCGYFRNITTLFGIVITDAYKGYLFHLNRNHRHKNMELLAFIKIVAKDMLNNELSTTPEDAAAHSILTTARNTPRTAEEVRTSALEALLNIATVQHGHIEDLSTITASNLSSPNTTGAASSKRSHHLINCTDFVAASCKEKDGFVSPVKRRRRGKCVSCGRNTSWYCPTCVPSKSSHLRFWCCNNDKNQCQEFHKNNMNEH